MLSKQQHKLLLTRSLVTRRSATNYPWTRHYCEKLRTCRWGRSTPWTTEMNKGCSRRGRGVASLWRHCPSPSPAQRRSRRAPPMPTASPVGKENPRWTTRLWEAFWEIHSRLTSQGSMGEPCRAQPLVIRGVKVYIRQPVLRSMLPLAAGQKQRSQPVALPISRAQPVTPSGQRAQLPILPDLDSSK